MISPHCTIFVIFFQQGYRNRSKPTFQNSLFVLILVDILLQGKIKSREKIQATNYLLLFCAGSLFNPWAFRFFDFCISQSEL